MTEFYCPHCNQLLAHTQDASFPPSASACPLCRLIVGAGRATRATTDAVSAGSAAGTLGGAARRAAAEPVPADVAVADMSRVAASLRSPNRLRMLDYDAAQKRGEATVTVAEIFATFGSWKAAASHLAGPSAAADDDADADIAAASGG